jgi:hypothetical protein
VLPSVGVTAPEAGSCHPIVYCNLQKAIREEQALIHAGDSETGAHSVGCAV